MFVTYFMASEHDRLHAARAAPAVFPARGDELSGGASARRQQTLSPSATTRDPVREMARTLAIIVEGDAIAPGCKSSLCSCSISPDYRH